MTESIRLIAEQMADRLDEPYRSNALADLKVATAEEYRDEHLFVRFDIDGYHRPEPTLAMTYPLRASVRDADGAKLSLALIADQNGRLYELEILRFDKGPVLAPDWSTFCFEQPENVIELNRQREK